MTLRLLEQSHVRAEQRMRAHHMDTAALIGRLRLEDQGPMGPGGQWGVHQSPGGQQSGEINLGAG